MAVKPAHVLKQDPMLQAILLAVCIHLAVIFGIGFGIDFPRDMSRATAVAFALTPASDTPGEAAHVAAFDQRGKVEPQTTELQFPGASLSIKEVAEDSASPPESAATRALTEQLASLQREVDALSGEPQPRGNPWVGAVTAHRALDADYLLRWQRRVEQVGNALYRRVAARHGSDDLRL